MADEPEVTEGAEETAPTPETAPEPAPEATPVPEDAWTDPAKVPAELQPLAKKFQASFTKRMQALAQDREAVDLVKNFRSNPEFARQVIVAEAQRLGIPLGAPTPQPGAAPAGQPTQDVAAIAARALPAELQWLAPSIAAAARAIADQQIAPVRQQLHDREQQEKAAQFEQLRTNLSAKYPGWEADEDELNDYAAWVQGAGPVVHPVYGNRLEALYNSMKGNALAEQTAIQRQQQAARSATRTGAPARSVTPNYDERIAKANHNRDAVAIALNAALEQMKKDGRAVSL